MAFSISFNPRTVTDFRVPYRAHPMPGSGLAWNHHHHVPMCILDAAGRFAIVLIPLKRAKYGSVLVIYMSQCLLPFCARYPPCTLLLPPLSPLSHSLVM